jgi:hypothetical protein
MLRAQRLWLRLQTLFRRNRIAQRLDEEIQFHPDQRIFENVSAGMGREEARYAAMRTFGNPTSLKEETRGRICLNRSVRVCIGARARTHAGLFADCDCDRRHRYRHERFAFYRRQVGFVEAPAI